MRRAAASDKISLKQDTDSLWGCVCLCVCCGNCYTCSGSTSPATWQENYLSRHSFSAGIKFSHSATSVRSCSHSCASSCFVLLLHCISDLLFKWELEEKKKRTIFEVRKKKVIASIGRELFPLSAPSLGYFCYLSRVSGFPTASAITALGCKSVKVNQAIRCKKFYKFISFAIFK